MQSQIQRYFEDLTMKSLNEFEGLGCKVGCFYYLVDYGLVQKYFPAWEVFVGDVLFYLTLMNFSLYS